MKKLFMREKMSIVSRELYKSSKRAKKVIRKCDMCNNLLNRTFLRLTIFKEKEGYCHEFCNTKCLEKGLRAKTLTLNTCRSFYTDKIPDGGLNDKVVVFKKIIQSKSLSASEIKTLTGLLFNKPKMEGKKDIILKHRFWELVYFSYPELVKEAKK